MKTMSARTGFGMNAHTIYVDALARQAGLLAGSGRMPAPVPSYVPVSMPAPAKVPEPVPSMVKPPASMPIPPRPTAHVSVPQRRPAYVPAPVRPVSSGFFEDS